MIDKCNHRNKNITKDENRSLISAPLVLSRLSHSRVAAFGRGDGVHALEDRVSVVEVDCVLLA